MTTTTSGGAIQASLLRSEVLQEALQPHKRDDPNLCAVQNIRIDQDRPDLVEDNERQQERDGVDRGWFAPDRSPERS